MEHLTKVLVQNTKLLKIEKIEKNKWVFKLGNKIYTDPTVCFKINN